MLCQNCNKNEANTHIKQIVNGERTETHLCSDCANHLGYNDVFSDFDLNFNGFFGGLLGDMISPVLLGNVKRCEKCGSSYNDIVREGKVGCADCYRTFYDKLAPSIQRIHGKIHHTGKTGTAAAQEAVKEKADNTEKIAGLKEDMDEAVKTQNFEEAARIRDEIKALEGGNNNE